VPSRLCGPRRGSQGSLHPQGKVSSPDPPLPTARVSGAFGSHLSPLYCRVDTRTISRFLGGSTARSTYPRASPASPNSWRRRSKPGVSIPWMRCTTPCFCTVHSSTSDEGGQPRNRCTLRSASSQMDAGRSWGFVFLVDGESTRNREEVLEDL